MSAIFNHSITVLLLRSYISENVGHIINFPVQDAKHLSEL